MMGTMATEEVPPAKLTTSREPKAAKRAGDPGSLGDQALMDAVYVIVGCWVALFLLAWTLRRHNV